MTLAIPYPTELQQLARKVAWYETPEETLADVPTFLAQLMIYGSPADVALAERYIPEVEFRAVLANPPAGVFTLDAWEAWHRRFGISPIPSLPRRRFPDGTLGPEAGDFFGR